MSAHVSPQIDLNLRSFHKLYVNSHPLQRIHSQSYQYSNPGEFVFSSL